MKPMKPFQSVMNDLFRDANGDVFEDAPKEIRDTLPAIAMLNDDTEDYLRAIDRVFQTDHSAKASDIRLVLDQMRAARDAFNMSAVELFDKLHDMYGHSDPNDDGDRAYDSAKDAGEL